MVGLGGPEGVGGRGLGLAHGGGVGLGGRGRLRLAGAQSGPDRGQGLVQLLGLLVEEGGLGPGAPGDLIQTPMGGLPPARRFPLQLGGAGFHRFQRQRQAPGLLAMGVQLRPLALQLGGPLPQARLHGRLQLGLDFLQKRPERPDLVGQGGGAGVLAV